MRILRAKTIEYLSVSLVRPGKPYMSITKLIKIFLLLAFFLVAMEFMGMAVDRRFGVQIPRFGIIVLFFIGVFFFFGILKKQHHGTVEKKFVICPKCQKTFHSKDICDSKCPKCKVELEDLRGFYNRNPEKNKARHRE